MELILILANVSIFSLVSSLTFPQSFN